MTRAKDELHLIAPLKYYVTQQSSGGDAHVYGAKSRFLTARVCETLQSIGWRAGDCGEAPREDVKPSVKIDAAARVRALL